MIPMIKTLKRWYVFCYFDFVSWMSFVRPVAKWFEPLLKSHVKSFEKTRLKVLNNDYVDKTSQFAQRSKGKKVDESKLEYLRKVTMPKHVIGCKRIIISDDWWPMCKQDNVEVVVKPIERITAKGIQCKDMPDPIALGVCAVGYC